MKRSEVFKSIRLELKGTEYVWWWPKLLQCMTINMGMLSTTTDTAHNILKADLTRIAAIAITHLGDDAFRLAESERVRQEMLKAQGITPWTCADIQYEGRTLPPETKLVILVEKIGEFALDIRNGKDPRRKLTQVCAVAVAWLEAL